MKAYRHIPALFCIGLLLSCTGAPSNTPAGSFLGYRTLGMGRFPMQPVGDSDKDSPSRFRLDVSKLKAFRGEQSFVLRDFPIGPDTKVDLQLDSIIPVRRSTRFVVRKDGLDHDVDAPLVVCLGGYVWGAPDSKVLHKLR